MSRPYVLPNLPQSGSPSPSIVKSYVSKLIVPPLESIDLNYRDIILADNPNGYWQFGETEGNVAFAEVGPNGEYLSGYTLGIDGLILSDDKAVSFNGINGRVQVPYDPALNLSVVSWECWARCDGGVGTYRSPMTSRHANPASGYIFYASVGNTWHTWLGNGAQWTILSGGPVVIGEIVHLVGVYDGAILRFYVNGDLINSVASSFSPNALRHLFIGAGGDAGFDFRFPGIVDEPAIYGYALSPEQVAKHYQMGTTGTVD